MNKAIIGILMFSFIVIYAFISKNIIKILLFLVVFFIIYQFNLHKKIYILLDSLFKTNNNYHKDQKAKNKFLKHLEKQMKSNGEI